MPNTVNAGWLKDKNGDKFAPKTLTSQVQTSDGTLIEDKIQADIDAAKEELAPLVGTTAEVTPAQVAEAVASGRPVAITHTEAPFGSIQYCYFNVSEAMGLILSTGIVDYGGKMTIELYGSIASGEWDLVIGSVAEKDDIPDAVVNPTSASVGQTIVVDEIGANGKPTKWKAADYQERTHWVVKGTTPIIAEQEFTFNSSAQSSLSETLNIVEGDTYVVVWDGVEYICECKSGTYESYPILYIGNEVVLGKEDDGIPFILGRIDVSGGISLIACLEPNSTHTAALYPSVVNKIPHRYLPKGIGDSKWVELLPETTLTFTNSQYEGDHGISFEAGKTYKIVWNGSEYICEASYFDLGTMAGNGLGNQAAIGGTDTGEPFMIGTVAGGTALLCVELTGATSATVSIMLDEVTTIHPKYLPDGIGYDDSEVILPETSVYVEQVDGGSVDIVLSPNETYVVTWNGVPYRCTSFIYDGMVFLGNLPHITGVDTGEPFQMAAAGVETYVFTTLPPDTTAINVSLSIMRDGLHKIPEKYLPEIDTSSILDSAKEYTDSKLEYAVSSHNTNTGAHNDIRLLIEGLTTRLNTIANSTDEDLDQIAELVAYIKDNKSLIDSITTSKINVADIADNLSTNVADKPLSAAQGVVIKNLIDALEQTVGNKSDKVDGKGLSTNDFTDAYKAKVDSALQSYTETDPTVPSWAKALTKPTYTKSEVGLSNVDNTSDADKPVSTAQKIAIDTALETSKSYTDQVVSKIESMPNVSEDDNGSFLRVVGGKWIATQIPNVEEGEF